MFSATTQICWRNGSSGHPSDASRCDCYEPFVAVSPQGGSVVGGVAIATMLAGVKNGWLDCR